MCSWCEPPDRQSDPGYIPFREGPVRFSSIKTDPETQGRLHYTLGLPPNAFMEQEAVWESAQLHGCFKKYFPPDSYFGKLSKIPAENNILQGMDVEVASLQP